MGFIESIKQRNLKPENVFISSYFAGLNELGILNQAVVYLAGRRVGRYLATYCKEQGNLESIIPGNDEVEQYRYALERLNTDLLITLDLTDVCLDEKEDYFNVKIRNAKCRFCPKGVGEAELTGTLCPFPGLIQDFLSTIVGKDIGLIKVKNKSLVKDGDWCKIRYA